MSRPYGRSGGGNQRCGSELGPARRNAGAARRARPVARWSGQLRGSGHSVGTRARGAGARHEGDLVRLLQGSPRLRGRLRRPGAHVPAQSSVAAELLQPCRAQLHTRAARGGPADLRTVARTGRVLRDPAPAHQGSAGRTHRPRLRRPYPQPACGDRAVVAVPRPRRRDRRAARTQLHPCRRAVHVVPGPGVRLDPRPPRLRPQRDLVPGDRRSRHLAQRRPSARAQGAGGGARTEQVGHEGFRADRPDHGEPGPAGPDHLSPRRGRRPGGHAGGVPRRRHRPRPVPHRQLRRCRVRGHGGGPDRGGAHRSARPGSRGRGDRARPAHRRRDPGDRRAGRARPDRAPGARPRGRRARTGLRRAGARRQLVGRRAGRVRRAVGPVNSGAGRLEAVLDPAQGRHDGR